MRIQVKLFAILRDQANTAEISLDLPTGATIADAIMMLGERVPALKVYLPRAAYAVNRSYELLATILHDGDELAIIPPVSGG